MGFRGIKNGEDLCLDDTLAQVFSFLCELLAQFAIEDSLAAALCMIDAAHVLMTKQKNFLHQFIQQREVGLLGKAKQHAVGHEFAANGFDVLFEGFSVGHTWRF